MAQSGSLFPTTSQTLLHGVRSPDPAQRTVAMGRFCSVYQVPIHALARSMGYSVEDAQDLVQDLFLKIIKGDVLQKFERDRGVKFSTWLITVFRNMAGHQAQAKSALKRGGQSEHVTLNTRHAEEAFLDLPQAGMEAPALFDLMLAREIWDRALERIRDKYATTQYSKMVGELEPLILLAVWPPPPAQPQAEFARRHGISVIQLRTFLSRNLRSQAYRYFAAEACAASPGITPQDVDELWQLLSEHVGE